MGLFSFIKDAGAKIFGGKTTAEKKDEAIAKLKNTVNSLDLKVSDLKIDLDDDKAMVWGEAEDQATKEKVVLVIGNSEGIAEVDDKMTVKPMPEEEDCEPVRESRFHTVKSGDTLSKVAKEVYGDAMKYPVIFEANKPMLSDPDKIYPGQVLRIPYLDEVNKVK
ncbi:peptidoglycan-binding protein LysM [Mesonia ostreae]|uniref:Peptidoglycan-binding protein LysM n=1 Tax=Mesonia ostreae TaxID=861110 RepID=A0ABU2KHF5_9FLAO|nr:peptidoglycan-binding protein LysM [Mesonia ostreae]MDT0294140.1 peptidoglycan-binding protein LysM [Mesonia ostreae]